MQHLADIGVTFEELEGLLKDGQRLRVMVKNDAHYFVLYTQTHEVSMSVNGVDFEYDGAKMRLYAGIQECSKLLKEVTVEAQKRKRNRMR